MDPDREQEKKLVLVRATYEGAQAAVRLSQYVYKIVEESTVESAVELAELFDKALFERMHQHLEQFKVCGLCSSVRIENFRRNTILATERTKNRKNRRRRTRKWYASRSGLRSILEISANNSAQRCTLLERRRIIIECSCRTGEQVVIAIRWNFLKRSPRIWAMSGSLHRSAKATSAFDTTISIVCSRS